MLLTGWDGLQEGVGQAEHALQWDCITLPCADGWTAAPPLPPHVPRTAASRAQPVAQLRRVLWPAVHVDGTWRLLLL